MTGPLIALALALSAAPPPATKVYTPLVTGELDQLAQVLRRRVAYFEVKAKAPESPLSPEPINGWGAPIDENLVVILAHVVKDATSVTVIGPTGRTSAEVVLIDLERRVAIVKTKRPVKAIGLEVVRPSPPAERKTDMNVFALVSTDEHAGVVHGVITHTGEMKEYEGHPRVDLRLAGGMPVFDDRARYIGFSRVVAWDADRYMIVPYEMIVSARTSTGAAASPAAQTPRRPWWGK